MEDIWSHFGNWIAVIAWIGMYGVFLGFMPFYKKSQWKPSGAYLAFVVAFALEMFGVPFSMYVIAWAFGQWLPDGILWGHTLSQFIGDGGVWAAVVMGIGGLVIVILGWKEIHKLYWSRESGTGQLVTSGIYRYIRHPQYTGFLMITFGMLCEWATLPLLLMWPALVVLYYKLALREEKDMEQEFGDEYLQYRRSTSMFLPFKALTGSAAQKATAARQ